MTPEKPPKLSLVKPPSVASVRFPDVPKDILIKVMRGFGIFTEPTNQPYKIRFTEGSNSYAPGKASIQVTAHGNGTVFSPAVIGSIARKFSGTMTEDSLWSAIKAEMAA
jgi:hypothetical protein